MLPNFTRRGLLLGCLLTIVSMALPDIVHAEDAVILTVSGRDSETGDLVKRDLSMADIEAMESSVLKTTTIWTSGEHEFRGVTLTELFRSLKIEVPARLRCTALNEYSVELPFSDTRETTVLMAYQFDGAYMRVRDKGPLWIVYPRDSGIINAADKMVWQLRELESHY